MSNNSLCISNKKYNVSLIIIVILIVGIPSLVYYLGFRQGSQSVYFTSSSVSPSIDGIITEGEWDRSDFIVQQYSDENNIEGNADDYNYMYLGENDDNLYVSIDVCSDLTNESDVDWIGVLINTDVDEDLETKEDWLESENTQGLFFNRKLNETFGNADQYIWDLNGEKEIKNRFFSQDNINMKYGMFADMDEYEYYNFTSDWVDGVSEYEDGDATMIFTEKVPYNEVQGFTFSLQLIERLFGLYDEEGDTISYMEFNISMNILDYFTHIPSEYLDYILDDMELSIDFAVIPMITYDYLQKGSLTYEQRQSAMDQAYDALGIYCNAYLINPVIDEFYGLSYEEYSQQYGEIDRMLFELMGVTDYLIGHDDLLEDGVLKKTLKNGLYNPFAGLLDDFSLDLNLSQTIKENNGWINFTILGLDALEDFGADIDLNLGFAFDYFNVQFKTSDSFNPNPIEINTIKNANISYGFDTSPNSDQNHRMVEISIPKSELVGFNGEDLGIMIVGFSGDIIPNSTVIGYQLAEPADNINYYFAAINSEFNGDDYFDSRNYYIVPVNKEEERVEDV